MPVSTTNKVKKARRAVIISGNRTPFVRSFGEFIEMDSIALGVEAVKGLLDRTELPRTAIDSVIWGGVILPATAPNLAREIALDLGLPPSAEGMTCTRACASGLQAITLAVAAIERGEADVIIAGGSDSTSNATIGLPSKFVQKVGPLAMGKGGSAKEWLGVLAQLHPIHDILPKAPKVAERTTGEVMGESAEKMARRNGITREDQDRLATMSHHRAAKALEDGIFDNEITAVTTPSGKTIYADNIMRGDTSEAKLAKLRAVFAKDGTLTAGNSSALTDGAAAVLIMTEEKAKEMGYTPLAAFKSWSYVGVDPADQLLMGPALSIPQALERAGLELKDIDFVDMHEAFAAQVLSILKMLGSDAFAKERLGRDTAVGDIDWDKLNLHGGSLALGHPFGATGARMVTTVANELHRRGKGTALLGICAAGGLGASAVMEAV